MDLDEDEMNDVHTVKTYLLTFFQGSALDTFVRSRRWSENEITPQELNLLTLWQLQTLEMSPCAFMTSSSYYTLG